MKFKQSLITSFLSLLLLLVPALLLADGTESLGPAQITIANGSGTVAAGTGLFTQPGTIDLTVPAGVEIKQVILYWEGFSRNKDGGDNEIAIQPTGGSLERVSGTLIGGNNQVYGGAWAYTYRADITALNAITAGTNQISVSEMDFTRSKNGAGLFVIYDDGTGVSPIQMFDGSDWAYIGHSGNMKVTDAKTFDFGSATVERDAKLTMFHASIYNGSTRPTSIEVTIGGVVTKYSNIIASNDGREWDTTELEIKIPAGVNKVKVETLSRKDLDAKPLVCGTPASLIWLGAGLQIVDAPPVCNIEGGGEFSCVGQITGVAFDATGSSDAEGQPLTYEWATVCEDATLSTQSGISTVLNMTKPGAEESQNCTVKLTVSDGVNSSSCEGQAYVEACKYDCLDELDGDAVLDDCGVCDGKNECFDCLDVAYGAAEVDLCGVCDGKNECLDCLDVPFGDAKVDECGVCDGKNSCYDCLDIPFGDAKIDECGVCDGDGTSCGEECVSQAATSKEVRTSNVVRKKAKVLLDRTKKFVGLAEECGGNDDAGSVKKARKRFKKTKKLLTTEISNATDVCSNSVCSQTSTGTVKRKLRKLAKKLYTLSKGAKEHYIGVCQKSHSGSGTITSETFYEDALASIKKLPDTTTQCN